MCPFLCSCGAGSFLIEGSDGCTPCARGEFQEKSGQEACKKCPRNLVTARAGAKSESDCIAWCPLGHYFDREAKICEMCGLKGYQSEGGSDSCLPCPPGYVPLYKNSTAIEHCFEECPPGSERHEDKVCKKCPIGSFKSKNEPMCMHCPHGSTTMHEGTKELNECAMEICKPGSYLSGERHGCQPCERGFFSNGTDSRQCQRCLNGTTTYKKGSTSANDCSSTDQCASNVHKCHWLAVCIDLPDEEDQPRYACKCRPGFLGNGFNCSDACVGLCLNDSECLKTGDGRTKCLCKAGFIGRRCERRIFQTK